MVQAQSMWAMNKRKQESAIYGMYWEGKGILLGYWPFQICAGNWDKFQI